MQAFYIYDKMYDIVVYSKLFSLAWSNKQMVLDVVFNVNTCSHIQNKININMLFAKDSSKETVIASFLFAFFS